MKITYEQALNRLAERTTENTSQLRKSKLQRRTEFTDLYGIPFTAQGDANNPATFYFSISPDLIYFLRFQFKLDVRAFATTMTGATESAQVTVNDRSLSVSGGSISPNPHDHTTQPHTHNVVKGMAYAHTTSDDFSISVNGVDITDYLIEQQDGDWIEGEGLYPTNRIENETDFYDLLDVATMLYNEGREEDAEKILSAEFKEVSISSDAPFGVTMYLYMKYSVTGR